MSSPQDLPHRLRDALVAADFTYDAVADLLGPLGHDALARNETVPGLRRPRDGSALSTLVRLFLLQVPVGLSAAESALPGLVDDLCAEGLLEQSVGEVAARLDVRPYATDDQHLWVVSDLTPGLDGTPQRVGPDHVLGISPASTSLAQLTLREPVGRALDLGTGCGVQALHLARHAEEMERNESFNFALFDRAETHLLGCVYIDPPERIGADAEISWWVVDELVGSELESELDAAIPVWIATHWPFTTPRFVGRDLSWAEWLALPEV